MLQNYHYSPLLYSRTAEIKALAQLPAATKDRIFPLIVSRPWPNAKQLKLTWEKIADAIGNRPYALDLDITKHGSNGKNPAAAEFDNLFDPRHGYRNYYEAISSIQHAVPVLRITGETAAQLDAQYSYIDEIDRGLIVRIQYNPSVNYREIINRVIDRIKDVSFFVDVGWSIDILGMELWASSMIEYISEFQSETEVDIVVCGSSFPDSFRNNGHRKIIPLKERQLYNSLVRRHNSASLIYGDWASTRPPRDPTPMRNIPRIDLPAASQWISFRHDEELGDEPGYRDIANRAIDDPEWPTDIDIWGTHMIKWTAKGEPGAIRSPAMAAAARINIHLHRQAFYGSNDIVGDDEEPYTDE